MSELVEKLRACANGIGDFKNERGDYGLCDTAADRIEQLEREQGWQDIATAPKDGTYFLGYGPDGVEFFHWQDKHDWPKGWRGALYVYPEHDGPTHWRPLPEPPAIRSGDAG